MTLTLRARVVLAAGAAILLAVVVVAVAVSVLVADQLRSSLDHSLHERAAEIASLSASAPAVLNAPGALDAQIGGQQLSVEVLDRRGRIVARSLSLGGSLLPVTLVRQRDRHGSIGVRNRPARARAPAPLCRASAGDRGCSRRWCGRRGRVDRRDRGDAAPAARVRAALGTGGDGPRRRGRVPARSARPAAARAALQRRRRDRADRRRRASAARTVDGRRGRPASADA